MEEREVTQEQQKKRNIIQYVTLGLILILFGFFAFGLNGNANKIKVGDKAIDFELDNMKKEKVKLSDFKGQVVVVNFFTTWCEPCREEEGELAEFQQYVEESGKATFLVIDRGETQKHVQKFIDEFDSKLTFLFDYNQAISDKFGVTGQPETIVIDKSGVVREHIIGPTTADNLEYYVEKYQ